MMGMNPKQVEQMMRKMGINQKELNVKKIVMELEDKKLVFINPDVSKINMMGKDTYQIVGNAIEEELVTEIEITAEDIETVMDQTGSSKDIAKKALEDNNGDIAKAILSITDSE